MIIIEGPDNSGKTTLGENLSTALGLPIKHSGGPIKSREDFDQRIEMFFHSEPMILDRWPGISECVYGQIFNRDYGIDFVSANLHALQRGFMFIYCRPDNSHLLDFTKHRPSEHTAPGVAPADYHKMVEAKQRPIIELYDLVMANVPHIRYDFINAKPLFFPNLAAACRRFQL